MRVAYVLPCEGFPLYMLVGAKHTSLMQIFAAIGSKFATKLVKTAGILVPMAAKIWWCAKTGQNRREFAASSFA